MDFAQFEMNEIWRRRKIIENFAICTKFFRFRGSVWIQTFDHLSSRWRIVGIIILSHFPRWTQIVIFLVDHKNRRFAELYLSGQKFKML